MGVKFTFGSWFVSERSLDSAVPFPYLSRWAIMSGCKPSVEPHGSLSHFVARLNESGRKCLCLDVVKSDIPGEFAEQGQSALASPPDRAGATARARRLDRRVDRRRAIRRVSGWFWILPTPIHVA